VRGVRPLGIESPSPDRLRCASPVDLSPAERSEERSLLYSEKFLRHVGTGLRRSSGIRATHSVNRMDACHATIFNGFRYRWSLPDRALDRAADVSAARALGCWVSDLRILLARGSEYVRPLKQIHNNGRERNIGWIGSREKLRWWSVPARSGRAGAMARRRQ
jgi:hypothetical protein